MFQMNAKTPAIVAMSVMALAAIAAIVLGLARGDMPAPAIAVAVAVLVSLAGVPILWAIKAKQGKLPNVLPGTDVRYSWPGKPRFTPEQQVAFLQLLRIEYAKVFITAKHFDKALQGLNIEWRDGESFQEGTRPVTGVARAPNHVICAARTGAVTIGSTSLTHEIVHHIIPWITVGNSNPDHSIDKEKCQAVERAVHNR